MSARRIPELDLHSHAERIHGFEDVVDGEHGTPCVLDRNEGDAQLSRRDQWKGLFERLSFFGMNRTELNVPMGSGLPFSTTNLPRSFQAATESACSARSIDAGRSLSIRSARSSRCLSTRSSAAAVAPAHHAAASATKRCRLSPMQERHPSQSGRDQESMRSPESIGKARRHPLGRPAAELVIHARTLLVWLHHRQSHFAAGDSGIW